ncbi:MAG: hypothetical protein AB7U64_05365 [Blastocatellales bacterium]
MLKTILGLLLISWIGPALLHSTSTRSDNADILSSEKQDPKASDRRTKMDEVDILIDRARNAPPEIAADIMFQLIETRAVIDPEKSESLLEELFDLSYKAQYKVKRIESIDKSGSRISNLNYAYSLNLDELSIQCRVVRLMIPLNKERAVELFKKIQLPSLDPLSCKDLMVYEMSVYYETLNDLVSRALVNSENKQLDSYNLIGAAITKITSPTQLVSGAKLLARLDLSSIDLEYFLPAYVQKLKHLSSDPRSLFLVIPSVGKEVKNLALKCKAGGVPYENLIDAYRTFLTENMKKGICDDFPDASGISEAVKENGKSFNSLLNELFPQGNSRVKELKLNDVYPERIEKSSSVLQYYKTPSGVKLMAAHRKLFVDSRGELRPVAEREKSAWANDLINFYNFFNSSARDEGMSEIDDFHNRCEVFGNLLEVVPKSNPIYADILNDYISLISQNRTQQESVIEWLWQARVVLLRMKLTKQSPNTVLKALSDSGDELLKLIAETRLFIMNNK